MRTILIRDDKHARVEVDLRRSLFKLTWKGSVPGPVLRRVLIQAHMQVVQHRTRYWLSDSRALTAILRQDDEWIRKMWVPRIFQAGLERLAIVQSPDYFYQTTANKIVDDSRPASPFPVQLFHAPEEAEHWLMEQDSAVA